MKKSKYFLLLPSYFSPSFLFVINTDLVLSQKLNAFKTEHETRQDTD